MVTVCGADGQVEATTLPESGCCPPDLCYYDACALSCIMLDLLPNGPMWDREKSEAIRYSQQNSCQDETGGVTYCPPDPNCNALVSYALLLGRLLHYALTDVLYLSMRESNPATAYSTLDDWLDRLGWQDCYGSLCRSPDLGCLTPFEVQKVGECGPVFCDEGAPHELSVATKRGIVLALSRLNMGIINNLCSINWVLEPLNTVMERDLMDPNPFGYTLSPISEELPRVSREICVGDQHRGLISAKYQNNCTEDGSPQDIYPGVFAAECIVRALLFPMLGTRLRRAVEESSDIGNETNN